MIKNNPYTVHEAAVAVFHAWGDGLPVGGPLSRHLQPPICEEMRAGLKITQVDGGGNAGEWGEWRKHRPQAVMAGDWVVEMAMPLGAMVGAGGVQLASTVWAGTPVVLVVRFNDRETGLWRVFQFHDAVVLPSEAGDESQRMMRSVRFSCGWMEEFKSGTMPGLVPRVRGVIEWRHLGRVVRCWDYDAETDTLTEDAENGELVSGELVRYVSVDTVGDGLDFSYLAAKTTSRTTAGGVSASGIGWMDAVTFRVDESSGLTLAPGWQLQTVGIAEPLLMPPSGRHWEHPRVVFRVLGRIYATIEAGVFALPAVTEGEPDAPMDLPIRLGRLVLYPDGGFVVGPEAGILLMEDGSPIELEDGELLEV